MIWATVSSRSCFGWPYRASPSLGAENITHLISVLAIWWSPCVESSLLLLEEGFSMTSVFSWQKSISLFPASFCTPRPNLPFTPGVSWSPTFASQSLWWKRHLLLVLILEGFVSPHRTIQRQLLQCYWLGRRLGFLWYWMVCPENKQRSFCHFGDGTQVLHFLLFCWLWGLLHFFEGILAHRSRYNGHFS